MARPTTIVTITDEQIEALKQEAGQAGNSKMVAICEQALTPYEVTQRCVHHTTYPDAGDPCRGEPADYCQDNSSERVRARHECVRVIREAEAQDGRAA